MVKYNKEIRLTIRQGLLQAEWCPLKIHVEDRIPSTSECDCT